MQAFVGLVRKDMKLSRFGYAIWVIGTALFLLGFYILALRQGQPVIIAPVYIILVAMHIPFGALMILSLLHVEGKTQLWLYNPQGSVKLLFSKLTTMVIYLAISQFVFAIYGYMIFKWLETDTFMQGYFEHMPWKAMMVSYTGVFIVTMTLAVWIIFLWTIYHSLSKFPLLRSVRWLVVVLVVVAYNVISTWLTRIKWVTDFVHLWTVDINFATSLHFEAGEWSVLYSEFGVPIIPIFIYIIIMSAMIFISSQLLDKKVEV